MSYTRINWENAPSTNTPVNATNLNKMDEGIYNVDQEVAANSSNISTLQTNVSANSNDITSLQSSVSDLEENKADWDEVYTCEDAEDVFMIKSHYHWGTGLVTSTNMYGTTISVDMETGDLNSSDQNGSSVKLVGNYQLFGNYCTMNGYISSIGYNQTTTFALPVAAHLRGQLNIKISDTNNNIEYYVSIKNNNRSVVTIAPVVASSQTGAQTALYFNITYKYQ